MSTPKVSSMEGKRGLSPPALRLVAGSLKGALRGWPTARAGRFAHVCTNFAALQLCILLPPSELHEEHGYRAVTTAD